VRQRSTVTKNTAQRGPPKTVGRFSIQSLLDDIVALRAAGVTALDPWWSRLGWDDNALMVEEDVYRVLDEEHRRVQNVYAEIVETSLSGIAAEMIRATATAAQLTGERRRPDAFGGCGIYHASRSARWPGDEALPSARTEILDRGCDSLRHHQAALWGRQLKLLLPVYDRSGFQQYCRHQRGAQHD
jgi:hypothetical protein